MNGLILIDKPAGMTSHDVIQQLRRLTGQKQIGHTGTLDPFATGLMVVLLGNATKLSKYYVEKDKAYSAQIVLGMSTDTDDATGRILFSNDASLISDEDIKATLKNMLGPQKQIPPNFSAIKMGGKKMYDMARKQEDMPTIEARDIEIYSMNLDAIHRFERTIELDMELYVSKGTYIRAIARDLGRALKTYGTLKTLRRTQVGKFDVDQAIKLHDFSLSTVSLIDPLERLDLPIVQVSDQNALDISYGRFLPVDLFDSRSDMLLIDSNGKRLAIYTYDETKNVMRMSVLLH